MALHSPTFGARRLCELRIFSAAATTENSAARLFGRASAAVSSDDRAAATVSVAVDGSDTDWIGGKLEAWDPRRDAAIGCRHGHVTNVSAIHVRNSRYPHVLVCSPRLHNICSADSSGQMYNSSVPGS